MDLASFGEFMKALIIGGGIGGPAVAVALQRAGHEAAIYEAHEGPAESLGLFLGIGVNGLRVLRDLDLIEAIYQVDSIPTPLMVFSSTTGKRLGTLSSGCLDGEHPSPTIMRGVLQSVLLREAVARGVKVHYGKRLTAITECGQRVTAHFADGSEAAADFLIGADGIHSRVRSIIDPDATGPSYTGLVNLGGVVPESGLKPTIGEMHMIWGTRAFFGYTVRRTGEAWWFANIGVKPERTPECLASVPRAEWRRELRALFVDDPDFIRHLIQQTTDIGAFPIHDMPSLASWHRGRTVLLGDAAHAVSPSAGQGASMALEDALVLAKCLRDVPAPQQAFAIYEALRRPRTERIVATGRRRSNYKALKSRTAVMLRDLVMPVAFKLFATEKAMSWIYDYEVNWNEPVGTSGGRPTETVPSSRD